MDSEEGTRMIIENELSLTQGLKIKLSPAPIQILRDTAGHICGLAELVSIDSRGANYKIRLTRPTVTGFVEIEEQNADKKATNS